MKQVVKLGGSLADGSALPACLDAVETYPGRTLLAPGGGIFAEQVRAMQAMYRYNDRIAHRMAILAMQQMAWLFHGLKPQFALISALEDVFATAGAGIWLPQPDELDAAGIPASWDITSDSLAAWLAARVGAERLILVKSARFSADATLPELQAQGVIDTAFLEYAALLACPITVINKDNFIAGL